MSEVCVWDKKKTRKRERERDLQKNRITYGDNLNVYVFICVNRKTVGNTLIEYILEKNKRAKVKKKMKCITHANGGYVDVCQSWFLSLANERIKKHVYLVYYQTKFVPVD